MDTAWFVSIFDRLSEKQILDVRLFSLDDVDARRAVALPVTESFEGGFELSNEQVKQLLGPKMKVVTLPQSRQIHVTELVVKHKIIRQVVNAGNQPGPGGFRAIPLKHVAADAALPVLRQSLGIVKGADVTPDGNPPNTPPSVRLTRSAVGNFLLPFIRPTFVCHTRASQMNNIICLRYHVFLDRLIPNIPLCVSDFGFSDFGFPIMRLSRKDNNIIVLL